MADIDIDFKDRIVEFPHRYAMTDNGDGTYTLIPFPGEVSEEGTPINAGNMNEIVSKHNALYDRSKVLLSSVPKRDVEGNIIYAVQVQDNPEQERNYGQVNVSNSGSHNFRILTLQPSVSKRFLRISYEVALARTHQYFTTSNFFLVNDTTSETLQTFSYTTFDKTYTSRTHTFEQQVNAGENVNFKVRHEWSTGATGISGTMQVYLRNFKIFCEDVEFTY